MNRNYSEEFIQYLGLDRVNVRRMLHSDESVKLISENPYTWDNLYGKNATLDLHQYIEEQTNDIKQSLEEKKAAFLVEMDVHLIPELRKIKEQEALELMLAHDQEDSLYITIEKEKTFDYAYLYDMNQSTYKVLEEENELAQKEKRGFWGHREERVANLLSSVDVFIQQVYEIYRCQAIEQLYQDMLEKIRQITLADIKND